MNFVATPLLLMSIGALTIPLPAYAQTTTTKYLNGKIAFDSDRDGNQEIYTANADGTNPTRLTNNSAYDAGPTWSPDSSKIAFSSFRDGNNEIYIMNADGTNQIRLTNNTDYDTGPIWSPDGSRIAFTTNRDGDFEVYTMNTDGTNPTRLTNNPAYDAAPAWSPDGTKIAFNSNRNGTQEIYTMNADGTNQTRLTNNIASDYSPAWSPNGNQLAFVSNRDSSGPNNTEIYTMNINGTNVTRLTNTVAEEDSADYSPDGTKLLVTVFPDQNYNSSEVYVMNIDGTGRTQLTNGGGYDESYSLQAWQRLSYVVTTNDNGTTTSTIAASSNYADVDYTVANNETLNLDGTLCDVTVASGGTLMGTGHACTITVNSGGTIAPGHSPGCITSGNLSLSGTYAAQIGGTTACSGYDQLQVTGTVTAGGTLAPTILNGFTPKAGDVFTIVSNDSNDPVSGTFTNLPEGATMTANGTIFKISYLGGDGNDITLTAQNTPTVPNTGVRLLAAYPAVSLGVSVVVASGLLYASRRFKPTARS